MENEEAKNPHLCDPSSFTFGVKCVILRSLLLFFFGANAVTAVGLGLRARALHKVRTLKIPLQAESCATGLLGG